MGKEGDEEEGSEDAEAQTDPRSGELKGKRKLTSTHSEEHHLTATSRRFSR